MIIHHHHHHVVPPAWISLTLSRHFSLSFIAFGRSSGLHYYNIINLVTNIYINNGILFFYCHFLFIYFIIKACQQLGFLWLSYHPSLSIITLRKSFWQHSVSAQSWWIYVFVGQLLTLVHPCVGVHLTCLVCEMGGKWLYSWCFVGCCF